MMTTRWNADVWNVLDELQSNMNRVFGRFGRPNADGPALSVAYPPLNVWADADRVYVEAELPGLGQEDIEIFVTEGDRLTLQGERRPAQAPEGVWHRQERGFGKFTRAVTLPAGVDPERVEARFENGVLRLTLPKAEAAKPRRIAVKAE